MPSVKATSCGEFIYDQQLVLLLRSFPPHLLRTTVSSILAPRPAPPVCRQHIRGRRQRPALIRRRAPRSETPGARREGRDARKPKQGESQSRTGSMATASLACCACVYLRRYRVEIPSLGENEACRFPRSCSLTHRYIKSVQSCSGVVLCRAAVVYCRSVGLVCETKQSGTQRMYNEYLSWLH